MGLGAILFVGESVAPPEDTAKENGVETLLGNKRLGQDLSEGDSEGPMMKEQEAIPELADAQIHQAISVISAD